TQDTRAVGRRFRGKPTDRDFPRRDENRTALPAMLAPIDGLAQARSNPDVLERCERSPNLPEAGRAGEPTFGANRAARARRGTFGSESVSYPRRRTRGMIVAGRDPVAFAHRSRRIGPPQHSRSRQPTAGIKRGIVRGQRAMRVSHRLTSVLM